MCKTMSDCEREALNEIVNLGKECLEMRIADNIKYSVNVRGDARRKVNYDISVAKHKLEMVEYLQEEWNKKGKGADAEEAD